MKRTFTLTHPKIKPARLADAIKHDLKKYFKKERSRELPEGANFWDFSIYSGASEESASEIAFSDINACIDSAVENGNAAIFFRIEPKVGLRKPALQ